MDSKEKLIARVVELEWDMFQQVVNAGGRAPCQDDPNTFGVMRASQMMSWSHAAVASYLNDLQEARQEGRNLLTEKYARMMKSTRPADYASFEHLLPALGPETLSLIDRIADIALHWQVELSRRFPSLVARGRPLTSIEDTPFVTSLETYLHGELSTYSPRTLGLLLEHMLEQKSRGVNGSEVVLEHMVRQYGYRSIQEAQETVGNHPAFH